MNDALLSVTVGGYDPTIWIPVIVAFFGMIAAIAAAYAKTVQNGTGIAEVRAIVNGNLTSAVVEIARLRTLLEHNQIEIPPVPAQPLVPQAPNVVLPLPPVAPPEGT